MKSNHKSTAVELSYFRLSLLSYLRDAHPDKAADRAFVASRGDAGAEAYSAAIKAGHTHDEADEIAARTLYAGLHFSPYRTLVTILQDEFADDTDPAQAEGLAMELLPRLSAILEKYTLTDDSADSTEYELPNTPERRWAATSLSCKRKSRAGKAKGGPPESAALPVCEPPLLPHAAHGITVAAEADAELGAAGV